MAKFASMCSSNFWKTANRNGPTRTNRNCLNDKRDSFAERFEAQIPSRRRRTAANSIAHSRKRSRAIRFYFRHRRRNFSGFDRSRERTESENDRLETRPNRGGQGCRLPRERRFNTSRGNQKRKNACLPLR